MGQADHLCQTPTLKREIYHEERKRTKLAPLVQEARKQDRRAQPLRTSEGRNPPLNRMPCYHPLQAWRLYESGEVEISNKPLDGANLKLPCGNCLGCRTQRAQAWALRCQLENQEHTTATFATLTYADEHLPLTLDKRHVQAYLKKTP